MVEGLKGGRVLVPGSVVSSSSTVQHMAFDGAIVGAEAHTALYGVQGPVACMA